MTRQIPVAKTARATVVSSILTIRGQRVILDADLANLYGVETRALNQAVKRNILKFPADFVFRLKAAEAKELTVSRSQFVILKRGENVKYLPYAFTEHGAVMAENRIPRCLSILPAATLFAYDRREPRAGFSLSSKGKKKTVRCV
jgi:hypothetical protein